MLVEVATTPYANLIVSMNTTNALTIQNYIINISSATATGNSNSFGTIEFMTNLV